MNSPNDRVMGKRYRLDNPDGSWWELGWDRPLGTYYAHQFRIDPTTDQEELVAEFGSDLREIRTVYELAERIGRYVPGEIGEELGDDEEAFPFQGPPRFYPAATALFANLYNPPEPPDPSGPGEIDDHGFDFHL